MRGPAHFELRTGWRCFTRGRSSQLEPKRNCRAAIILASDSSSIAYRTAWPTPAPLTVTSGGTSKGANCEYGNESRGIRDWVHDSSGRDGLQRRKRTMGQPFDALSRSEEPSCTERV